MESGITHQATWYRVRGMAIVMRECGGGCDGSLVNIERVNTRIQAFCEAEALERALAQLLADPEVHRAAWVNVPEVYPDGSEL